MTILLFAELDDALFRLSFAFLIYFWLFSFIKWNTFLSVKSADHAGRWKAIGSLIEILFQVPSGNLSEMLAEIAAVFAPSDVQLTMWHCKTQCGRSHMNTMEPIVSFSLTCSLSVILFREFCGLELNEQVRFWAPFALLVNWLDEQAEIEGVPSAGGSAIWSAEPVLICESLGGVVAGESGRFSAFDVRCDIDIGLKCWWRTWCLGELEVKLLLFRSASRGVSGCRCSAWSPLFSRRSPDSFSRLYSPLLAGSMQRLISCFSYSSSWPRKLKFGEMVARFPFKYLVEGKEAKDQS